MRALRHLIWTTLLTLTISCGGGSSSSNPESTSGTTFIDRGSLINVALPIFGTSTSASYDETNASNLADEDTTAAFTWSGNITGDYVEFDFGALVYIDLIKIFGNPIFVPNFDGTPWIVEVSENKTDWRRTFFFGIPPAGSTAISCNSINVTPPENSITCPFNDGTGDFSFGGIDARYLRITITEEDAASVLSTFLFEVQVIGV